MEPVFYRTFKRSATNWEEFGKAMNQNIKTMLGFSFSKLEKNLALVRKQQALAFQQNNEKALIKLQKWEWEIIQAINIKAFGKN